jgi:hypothetical protein
LREINASFFGRFSILATWLKMPPKTKLPPQNKLCNHKGKKVWEFLAKKIIKKI